MSDPSSFIGRKYFWVVEKKCCNEMDYIRTITGIMGSFFKIRIQNMNEDTSFHIASFENHLNKGEIILLDNDEEEIL